MVYVTLTRLRQYLADRIMVFFEGRIEQISGAVKTRNLFGDLRGSPKMNILPADRFAYDTTGQRQAGDVVHVGIRPGMRN